MKLLAVDIGTTFFGPNGGDKFKDLTTVSSIVTLLLRFSLFLAGLILLFYFILGGIGMMSSAGKNDPKAAEQAKQTITTALIGFIVVQVRIV